MSSRQQTYLFVILASTTTSLSDTSLCIDHGLHITKLLSRDLLCHYILIAGSHQPISSSIMCLSNNSSGRLNLNVRMAHHIACYAPSKDGRHLESRVCGDSALFMCYVHRLIELNIVRNIDTSTIYVTIHVHKQMVQSNLIILISRSSAFLQHQDHPVIAE
jgi:hypothetical protein